MAGDGVISGRAPSDLVRQMWLLISEQVFLWDLTRQVTDYYSEKTVTHGPWQASDCKQIISRWFDCGLVDCIATSWGTRVRSDGVVHFEYDADWRARATESGQYLVLAREDAGALLSDPSTWRPEGDGAGVMVCESDEADGLSFDDWFAKLAGLPDHLIYGNRQDGASDVDAQQAATEPEEALVAGLWMDAVENAATNGLPVLCPVNGDAYLNIDWEKATGETATAQSIEDIFCFIDRGKPGRGDAFPFGRHRLWCPSCGAERWLVVTRRPD